MTIAEGRNTDCLSAQLLPPSCCRVRITADSFRLRISNIPQQVFINRLLHDSKKKNRTLIPDCIFHLVVRAGVKSGQGGFWLPVNESFIPLSLTCFGSDCPLVPIVRLTTHILHNKDLEELDTVSITGQRTRQPGEECHYNQILTEL